MSFFTKKNKMTLIDGIESAPIASSERSQSVHNYCFTFHNLGDFYFDKNVINERYTALETLVKNDKCSYIIGACEQCPSSGRLHMQGFLTLKRKTRKATVINLLKELMVPFGSFPAGLSLEPFIAQCRGSALENFNYCAGLVESKGMTLNPHMVEYGKRPLFKDAGAREKSKYSDVVNLAKSGNLAAIERDYPDVYLRMYGTLHRIAGDNADIRVPLSETCGIILYGFAGTGKSLFARKIAPNAYLKALNLSLIHI